MADEAEVKKVAKLDFDVDVTKLDTINTKLKEIETTAEKINKNLKINFDIDTKSISNDVQKLEKEISKIHSSTNEDILKKDKIYIRNSQLGQEELQNKLKIIDAKRVLNYEKNNQQILKSTQTLSDKISEYAKTYLIYQGFNKLKSIISDTIDEMVDLQYQMVQIDRVLNESSLDIDSYRDELLQLAYDYGNEMDNVTDVALRLAQAGFDSSETLKLTEKTLLALNTAELDATQATEDMVAVMAQWGLMTGDATQEAKDYGDIIDKINKVADNFPTTSEDILEALKKTSSAFNLAGASIDETIATIVSAEVASQRGGKVIGTALSNIVQQLKAEGKINIMESLGLDIYTDSTKTEFKGIMEILEQLSQKMEQLKNEGKENSVEMQNLLEVFTVFRRNIGASLLGEMAGEESTYAEVLKTSLDSIGYSLNENAKHMETAKAAQAQFNAELLKLKTEVWDKGLENVFRDFLNLGSDLINGINNFINKFGILPTSIGAITIAFTALNKNFQTFKYNSKTNSIELSGFIKKIKEATEQIRNTNKGIITLADNQGIMITNSNNSAKAFAKNALEVTKYSSKLVLATVKTIALQAATIALNAAISMGLSLAITAITSAIDNWIHKEEKAQEIAIETSKKVVESKKEEVAKLEEEKKSLDNLINKYKEYAEEYSKKNKKDLSEEDYQKIYELQENINNQLKDSEEQIELIKQDVDDYGDLVWKVNDAYDAQSSKLESIDYQNQKNLIKEKQELAESIAAQARVTPVSVGEGDFFSPWKAQGLLQGLADIGEVSESVASDWGNAAMNLAIFVDELNNQGLDTRVEKLKEMKDALEEYINAGKADEQTKEAYNWISEEYTKQKDLLDQLTEANEGIKESMSDLYSSKGFIDSYTSNLYSILKNYDSQSANQIAEGIIDINKQFKEGKLDVAEYFNWLNQHIKKIDFSVINKQIESTTEAAKIAVNAGKNLQDNLSGTIDIISTRLKQNAAAEQVIDFATVIGKTEEEVNNLKSGFNKLFDTTRGEFFGNLKESIAETKDSLTEFIKTISEIPEKVDAEALQAIFASTTEMIAESVSTLNTQFSENKINFVEYTNGINEAGSSVLELYASQNQLAKDQEGIWRDAKENVDEYANSLQKAINELNTMSPLLKVIGDNYDYIAQNANSSGEAAFTAADMGTVATQNFTNQFIAGLQEMKKTNEEAYNAIVNKAYSAMGDIANESINVEEYVIKHLNNNNNALNAALDEAAAQAARAAGDLTVTMGDVFKALGDAIKEFDFNIQATPYIKGSFGLHKDKEGMIDGISLPTFGFDIKGTGGDSFQTLGNAISTFGSNLVSSGAQKYKYKPVKTTSTPYKPGGTTSGTPSASSTAGSTSTSDADKAAEEEYKARLNAFKEFVSERERLEKRWVDKQKELGLLTIEDEKYITEQRIKRYQQYLDQVKQMTWLNEEDRLALEKEYSEKIEDLQLDYIGLLKDQLKEQQEALEDANDEKIKLIKEEAQARIDALKEVEDENDRIRAKEEYLNKRQEHLDDISYWEQRTGREAQEALIEARKNLSELDEEWQEQLEDWDIEDQITAIEEERDAQIAAIEEAQEAELKAMQELYDAKVKLFGETGQIIYDNSVIQSQELYQAYKTNFVDPLTSDLANLNTSITTPSSTTTESEQQYETYTIKSGDTLSRIASKFGTTVDKIMSANPYIKNKNLIYSGNTLQIPKFHEGGIVGGNKEGFALLKPKEVILKPEWADGINRLAKMAKKQDNIVTNSTVIEVKGDLVRIDANIKNKTDAEYLTKKVEKMLKDKFNIKK